MTARRRFLLLLTFALMAGSLSATASAGAPGDTAADVVEDDLLQITLNRLYAEATEFFHPDFHSITVIRLSDGHMASVDGDERHISLSAAKVIWVVKAVKAAGVDAVQPYAGPIFQNSSNAAASQVISLVGSAPHKGVDRINKYTWSLDMENTYVWGWYSHSGCCYGWHKSSKPLPSEERIDTWFQNNFTSTNDLASFWAMLADGDLLGPAKTAKVLHWGTLPRPDERHELITNRLPSAVASNVSHKAGWNSGTNEYPKSRRIDGGIVTTPSGERYAIAISFRTSYESEVDYGAASWARYASCEVYNVIAGKHRTCTESGDPYEIVNDTTAPIGALKAATADRQSLKVRGWALDRDAGPDPIDVRITVDGTPLGTITADRLKTSIERKHGLGNYHGFRATFAVRLPTGDHTVCAVGLNDSAAGSNRTLGCRTVTVPKNRPPVGKLSAVRVETNLIVARGRARDPNTDEPIQVKIKFDGKKIGIVTADGGTSGRRFKLRLHKAVTPGDHTVCAIAIDSEGGRNTRLGCETVTVPDG